MRSMVMNATLWALALLGGFAGTFWLSGWYGAPLLTGPISSRISCYSWIRDFIRGLHHPGQKSVHPSDSAANAMGGSIEKISIGVGVSYLVIAVLSGITMALIIVLSGHSLESETVIGLLIWTFFTPLWFLPLGGAVYAWLKLDSERCAGCLPPKEPGPDLRPEGRPGYLCHANRDVFGLGQIE